MDENRNAAIKLFGKRIPLLKEAGVDEGKFQPRDLHMEENYTYTQLKDQDDKCELTACTSENHKTPLVEQEAASAKKSTPEEKHNEASDPMEKTPKKPDKILPCPRCKSMDTKFCYYNNYNVNQPRYLCKNCQRYWTAGGTMRNVPVGSGRRKNKSSCHYLQIAIPKSAVQALQSDETLLLHPCSTPSSTLLSFGSNAAPCTNPPEKVKKLNSPRNGLHRVAPPEHFATNNGEDRRSEETARLALNEKGNQNSQERNPPFPSSNIGSTWPYPWNPALPFRAPSIPIPIYPAAYWSCTVPLTSHLAASAFANDCYPAAATTSFPTEHLWREDSHKQNHEASILVPKTLRIDDPDEAAKSSIWTMISNKNNAVGGGHLHNAFQPKGDMKKRAWEAPPLLHANPAALSRSLNFQETS